MNDTEINQLITESQQEVMQALGAGSEAKVPQITPAELTAWVQAQNLTMTKTAVVEALLAHSSLSLQDKEQVRAQLLLG